MKLSKLKARTSTRTLAGHSIPRQNTTSIGMRSAMKAYGGSCGDVEGDKPRARLDRPKRIMRADGGRISEDSKQEAAKLRDEATTHRRMRNVDAAQTLANGVVGMLSKGKLRAANAAFSGLGALNTAEREQRRDAAEAEARRIERGEAEPGKEDRAKGGKVEDKKWVQGAIKKPGALHKSLHVPEGQKIPEKKLEKAEHSSNPTLRKRAVLARTMRGWKKG